MNRLLILVFFFFTLKSFSQQEISVSFTNDSYKRFKKNIKFNFKDSTEASNYLSDVVRSARKSGFLLANVDSIQRNKNEWIIALLIGERYNRMLLTIPEKEKSFLLKSGLGTERFLFQPDFQPEELVELMEKWKNSYLNEGFPFAKITLKVDSVVQENGFGTLDISRGMVVRWTKIHVKGDTNVSESFVSSLLQIKVKDLYSENKVSKISEKIKQVAFLEELKPYELLFTQNGVELFLYLKSKPVSSLNGFVGLQPKTNSGYSLAGDISLKLWNIFKKGEFFDLSWRNIQGQTQQLKTNLNLPYLFKTPFGLDGSFQLYKRDSSFLDIQSKLAVEYQLGGNSKVYFFYQRINSSVLKPGLTSTAFPNLASVSSNNYGLGYQMNKVDYLPNPRSGITVSVSVSVGTRLSKPADSTASTKGTQYQGKLEISYYQPMTRRTVFRLSNQSWLLGAPVVYQNELNRFGGLLQQRGFNEDELFASAVSTTSLEFRFLLDKDSRLFLFYDHTWYENRALTYFNDQPIGFGGGLAFGTNIGTFSILYALGRQQNNAIEVRNGRVHFGYIAYF